MMEKKLPDLIHQLVSELSCQESNKVRIRKELIHRINLSKGEPLFPFDGTASEFLNELNIPKNNNDIHAVSLILRVINL